MLAAVLAALLVAMALGMIRAIAGPSVFDRILAVNYAGTVTVLLLAVLGYAQGRPDFLDISLLYALINFVGTLAVLKFSQHQDLGAEPVSSTQSSDSQPQTANSDSSGAKP